MKIVFSLGIVNYVEFLLFICLKYKAKKSKAYQKLTMPFFEYTGVKEENNKTKSPDIIHFKGDGDFRSVESIELLKQSDIVVTNPLFSLFREYVNQLVKYDKKFLIIGNINAITYKEILALLIKYSIQAAIPFNDQKNNRIN